MEDRPSFSKYYIRLREPEKDKEVVSLEEVDDTPTEEVEIPINDTPLKSLEEADPPSESLVIGTVKNAIRHARRSPIYKEEAFVHPTGEEDTFEEDADDSDVPLDVAQKEFDTLGLPEVDAVAFGEAGLDEMERELQEHYKELEKKDGGTRKNKRCQKRMTKKRKTRRSKSKRRKCKSKRK